MVMNNKPKSALKAFVLLTLFVNIPISLLVYHTVDIQTVLITAAIILSVSTAISIIVHHESFEHATKR